MEIEPLFSNTDQRPSSDQVRFLSPTTLQAEGIKEILFKTPDKTFPYPLSALRGIIINPLRHTIIFLSEDFEGSEKIYQDKYNYLDATLTTVKAAE